MERFRLKKEARQFFDKEQHVRIETLEVWNSLTISEVLLEPVGRVLIEYGIVKDDSDKTKLTNLCSWKGTEQEAEFKFTLRVSDITNKEYTIVDKVVLMDALEETANKFFTHK